MTPIYKKSGFSKKFIGVQIPIEYVDNIEDAKDQLRRLGLQTFESNFIVGNLIGKQKIGAGILGTVEWYDGLAYSKSTCAGICLSFGSKSSGKYLTIGEDVTYGISMNWTIDQRGDARDKTTYGITDPISSIINIGNALVDGESAMEVAIKTARYGNYRIKAQNRNPHSVEWPRAQFRFLSELPNEQIEPALISVHANRVKISSDLNAKMASVKKNIMTEIEWQLELRPMNDQAPIWDNKAANSLVQTICDSLQKVNDGPTPLGPRCRVFASLTPNAYSYPGGDIFISAGLLGILPNVDSLVFMLAHEYVHTVAAHTTARMEKQDRKAAMLTTMSLLTNAASLGSSQGAWELAKNLGAQEVTMESLQFAAEASLAYATRGQEDEADELGIEMAMNLGAHPQAVLEGIEAVRNFSDDTFKKQQKGIINQLMTDDHNNISSRIKNIESRATRYVEKMRGRNVTTRQLDSEFASVTKQLRPLMNFYRLNLKSLQ